MNQLILNKELFTNIYAWMTPRYSINTVKQYSNYMRTMFKKYGVLNHDTLKKINKTIKHQNQRAVLTLINDYCFYNNIDFELRLPKLKRKEVKLPNILSPSEVKLMIDAAPKPYDLAIRCIFNMGAGLRVSEIIKFSWKDIRWIDWLSNQDNYGVATIRAGKGSKDRVVNIPKNLMKDLYEYAKEQGVLNEFRVPNGSMIFEFGGMTEDGIYKKELMANNINLWKNAYVSHCYNWFRYNIIQKHCEKALNKKIHIHWLRHSRATYLYEYEKVPIEKISILLGHSSFDTTMLYTKINPVSVFESIKDTKEV